MRGLGYQSNDSNAPVACPNKPPVMDAETSRSSITWIYSPVSLMIMVIFISKVRNYR